MPNAYTEDQLVEQPAIGLFAELGWQTVSALEEIFGAPSPGLSATLSHPMGEGASLGRETKGEVVLVSRLRAALERLNPAPPRPESCLSGWRASAATRGFPASSYLNRNRPA